jgi:hypothetical protein
MHSRPRSCGGASGVHRVVSEDPKCMLLRVVAGRTAPEIQCRVVADAAVPIVGNRCRNQPAGAEELATYLRRWVVSWFRYRSTVRSTPQVYGRRGQKFLAADATHTSRDCTAITGVVKCFGGDGYPRIALSRNHQRLLMSQRNMGRRSGLDAAGHTTCASRTLGVRQGAFR